MIKPIEEMPVTSDTVALVDVMERLVNAIEKLTRSMK